MKMTTQDYTKLKSLLSVRIEERQINLPQEFMNNQCFGFSGKRFRWVILRLCGIIIGDGAGAEGDLNFYSYLDDKHIDTGLKRAVNELVSEAWPNRRTL